MTDETEDAISPVAIDESVTLDDLLDRFDPAIHRHDLVMDWEPVGTETKN